MEVLASFLSIHNAFLTVLGYPLSYIEFLGIIFNILGVYLAVQNHSWTWPVGNIGVVLFALLFYQIQLYSDFFEQIYFLITGFYGWWAWAYLRRENAKTDLPVTRTSQRSNVIYSFVIIIGTVIMGYSMSHIHEWLPTVFPKPAFFPYLDALTTVMSFAATILMAHKKLECWVLWLLVDLIGTGIYLAKGIVFVALLYAIFLLLAIKGLFHWRQLRSNTNT